LGVPKYNEGDLLNEIIENSPTFHLYYLKKRDQINHKIVWRGDEERTILSPGIMARKFNNPRSGLQIIVLKQFPPQIDDAYLIAHEMEHLIQDSKKKVVSVAPLPQMESLPLRNLASAITSMIADILADDELLKFGFNVIEVNLKEFQDGEKRIQQMDGPLDPHNTNHIINYAAHLLTFDHFFDKKTQAPQYFSHFDRKNPSISQQAKHIMKIVQKIGYDTPEKQRRIYDWIIHRYKLENHLGIFS
jgi:hypothetical protein